MLLVYREEDYYGYRFVLFMVWIVVIFFVRYLMVWIVVIFFSLYAHVMLAKFCLDMLDVTTN